MSTRLPERFFMYLKQIIGIFATHKPIWATKTFTN